MFLQPRSRVPARRQTWVGIGSPVVASWTAMVAGPLLVNVMMCSRLSAPPTDESLRPTNVRLAVGIGTGVGVGDGVGFGVGVGFAVGFGVGVGDRVGDGLALGPFEGARDGDADAAASR